MRVTGPAAWGLLLLLSAVMVQRRAPPEVNVNEGDRRGGGTRHPYIGFRSQRPKVVFYIQRVHTDMKDYSGYVRHLMEGFRSQVEPGAMTIVFWPESRGQVAEVITGTEIFEDIDKFVFRLQRGRATADGLAFKDGLSVCAREATRLQADIVIVTNAQDMGLFEVLGAAATREQGTALTGLSQQHPVHVICYAGSAEDYTRYISGYAVSVSLGAVTAENKGRPGP